MRRYDLLAAARDDILELAEYASEYSDRARDSLTEALVECFERLGDFPESGRTRPDLHDRVRSVPINRLKVTVYYFTTEEASNQVLIARVLRQERNVSSEDFK